MAIAREAEPVGSLKEVREAGLDREDLLGAYRSMLLTRGIEERGHILYRQGKIPGSFYTGRGNQAAAVGVAAAMGPEGLGTPPHRLTSSSRPSTSPTGPSHTASRASSSTAPTSSPCIARRNARSRRRVRAAAPR